MKAGRLTDGVDVFLERESVIQNDTQSPKLLTLSDVSAVTSPRSTEVTWDSATCLALVPIIYNGFSFIRVEGIKSVQIEPVVQSAEAVSQYLSGVGVSEC